MPKGRARPKPSATAVNVKVVVRCRPLNAKEKADHSQPVVSVENNAVTLVDQSGRNTKKVFTYDHAFFEETNNAQFYNILAPPLIDKAFEGYNGTMFAYGQTGTGKTYSMMGSEVRLL